jgi:hypothetical protein
MTKAEIEQLLNDIETNADEAEFYDEVTPNNADIKNIIDKQINHIY